MHGYDGLPIPHVSVYAFAVPSLAIWDGANNLLGFVYRLQAPCETRVSFAPEPVVEIDLREREPAPAEEEPP